MSESDGLRRRRPTRSPPPSPQLSSTIPPAGCCRTSSGDAEVILPAFELYVAAVPATRRDLHSPRPTPALRCGSAGPQLLDLRTGGIVRCGARRPLGPDVRPRFQLARSSPSTTPPSRCTTASSWPPCRRSSRGLGSVFLRDMLGRADPEGMPAYHEATSPRNQRLTSGTATSRWRVRPARRRSAAVAHVAGTALARACRADAPWADEAGTGRPSAQDRAARQARASAVPATCDTASDRRQAGRTRSA